MPDDGQQLHIFSCFNSLSIAICMGVACSMYKEQLTTVRYGVDCTILRNLRV